MRTANGRYHWLRVLIFSAIFAVSPLFLGGCEMYDWLVDQIQTSLSPVEAYHVSVIDCKVIPVPGSILRIESSLSKRLSTAIRDGVDSLGSLPNFRNVKRVDSIPSALFPVFHNDFFADNVDFSQRTAVLRNYCDKYNTNIVMWGVTMGDDYEMSFVAFLYRRDLNAISQTESLVMTEKMSERVQESLVSKASTDLLRNSLESSPIGSGDELVTTLRENKEIIVMIGTMLYGALTAEGDYEGNYGY